MNLYEPLLPKISRLKLLICIHNGENIPFLSDPSHPLVIVLKLPVHTIFDLGLFSKRC